MSVWKEFKEFAIKGNVLDLAVGVILGASFGKITSSLVNDILLPPIGYFLGGPDFSNKQIVLRQEAHDAAGKIIVPATAIKYGQFLSTVIDFFLVAIAIFVLVKLVNIARRKAPATPPGPTKTEVLLTEIRDALQTKRT